MAAYPRYRFDHSFGAPAAVAEPEAAEAVDPLDLPTLSEREHRAALGRIRETTLAEGLVQGRREGELSAARRIEAELSATLDQLAQRMAALDADHAALMERLEAEGAFVLLALVRRMAPRLLDQVARAEVERLAADALRAAGQAPMLTLRLHPSLCRPLEERLAGQGVFRGRLDIQGDPALPIGALEANWGAGSVRRDPATIQASIEAAVADLTDRAVAALQPALSPDP
ncbi:flagellar assembly protein FliH [Azospirillum sp. TSH100]|uniref:flagellar assembly protein FliH n=1 Tax=Azospirillum sp. TSH100 TaxID=652764 RepID=UPI000D615163|nr:flagellar assembly protein FliH [Azospirillum sp. TSH100]PWC80566.1 flagellar assembly protein FliH [Azospirillum sp. TSH100]QCG91813.1 flagellar assembly protein FliH [Azospirillum sp. TSH100]